MNKINVEIVTPEKLELSDIADSITIPASQGEMGILVDHSPMIANMKRGVVVLNEGDSVKKFFVEGGFVEVTEEKCNILATKSEDVSDLDDAQLQAKIELSD